MVPIDPFTVDVLRNHQVVREAERTACGETRQEHGLIRARENGDQGVPPASGGVRPDVATHTFGRLVEAAGVPRIRLHDLRHTHASLALAAGVDIKVVSDRLGHSTTTITADLYTHVVPAVARSAADAIAAAVAYTRGGAARDISEVLAHADLEGAGRGPPEGEVAGQAGRPRGTRTHNPRIKRAGRGVRRGPGRVADLRRWCAGVWVVRGGCRRVAVRVAVSCRRCPPHSALSDARAIVMTSRLRRH
ncbi:hypothetical protein NUM3379_16730 [Kineococcus sp. NUM-3379]